MSPTPERPERGLLDTSVVIHLPGIPVEHLPVATAISTITLAELTAGPLAADDPEERARRTGRLQRAEATFDPLPFDTAAARAYGPVFAALRAASRSPGGRFADVLIACVALANDLPLFTTNPVDFAGLGDLVTIVPVARPSPGPL